jgi:hypothetical protein
MDTQKPLKDFDGEVAPNATTYNAAMRPILSVATKHDRLNDENERLKDFVSSNKVFPIMLLPRELRDEIYTHALCARGISVGVKLRFPPLVCIRNNRRKPPTSSLLRVSRQVYQETIGKLYTDNILYFRNPGQMYSFEQQIGAENRMRVKKICICIRFPLHGENSGDPRELHQSKYKSVLSHWIAALSASSLTQVVHLGIQANMTDCGPLSIMEVSKDLEESIKEFLGRAIGHAPPRLSMVGFSEDQREKFPANWDVVMDQWQRYKDALALVGDDPDFEVSQKRQDEQEVQDT